MPKVQSITETQTCNTKNIDSVGDRTDIQQQSENLESLEDRTEIELENALVKYFEDNDIDTSETERYVKKDF